MNNNPSATASPDRMLNSNDEVIQAVLEEWGPVVARRLGTTEDDPRVVEKLLDDMTKFDPSSMNWELLRSSRLCRMIGAGAPFNELEACVNQIAEEQKAAESKRQSERARASREQPLDELIVRLLLQNPLLSSKQLPEALKNSPDGVVVSVDDTQHGYVRYRTSSGIKSCKISGLQTRLSRIKNKN